MTSTTRPTARRGCAPLGLLLLAACGGAPPVTMSCRVAPATPTPGVPLVAVVTLENVTPETVTILGMSLPWLYRHAAHFEAAGFEDPHVIADPGVYETLILLPGESAGGEVPLHDRLQDQYGRSLTEVPGSYDVGVRARLTLDPESPRQRAMEARCRFDLVVPARE